VVANPTPSLPPHTGYPPILNKKWEKMPSVDEMVQLRVLLAKLSKLKAEKLNGAAMALLFFKQSSIGPTQDTSTQVGMTRPG
jgi:hypothetical protein